MESRNGGRETSTPEFDGECYYFIVFARNEVTRMDELVVFFCFVFQKGCFYDATLRFLRIQNKMKDRPISPNGNNQQQIVTKQRGYTQIDQTPARLDSHGNNSSDYLRAACVSHYTPHNIILPKEDSRGRCCYRAGRCTLTVLDNDKSCFLLKPNIIGRCVILRVFSSFISPQIILSKHYHLAEPVRLPCRKPNRIVRLDTLPSAIF